MPWVNIFEHEECEVVIGLIPYGNSYPPAPWAVFPLAKSPATPQLFEESIGIYSIDVADGDTGRRVIGTPLGVQHKPLPWGMYIIPSGGVAGRRFRARVLRHTSAFNEPSDEGFILCPGYFVDGCGAETAYDEAAIVPFNPSGNPPEDSEWYEFEEVAAEPDAGGLDTTGWVGLFNYSYEDYSAAFPRGFFEWQVWVDDPPPPEPESCEEHGRVTRAYVSGYQRDRIHRSRLVRGERRCLVANFNGAIPRCRTIARVIWRCDQNQAVYMENARIVREGREVAVDITAQIGWGARVKCEAVLDNGEVYTQLFVIRVVSPPYFMGEPTWYAQGPTELVATA